MWRAVVTAAEDIHFRPLLTSSRSGGVYNADYSAPHPALVRYMSWTLAMVELSRRAILMMCIEAFRSGLPLLHYRRRMPFSTSEMVFCDYARGKLTVR